MKNNTLLYIGAGAAVLYLLSRQASARDKLPSPTLVTRKTGGQIAFDIGSVVGPILATIIGTPAAGAATAAAFQGARSLVFKEQ